MRIAPVTIIVLSGLLLLTWLLMNGLNLNSARYDRELRVLDEFSQLERRLNREVLTARAGLSRNYDALVQMTDAYAQSLDRLREAARSNSEEGAAIEVLATRARRQQDLIETFKRGTHCCGIPLPILESSAAALPPRIIGQLSQSLPHYQPRCCT